ncbi:MAG: MFS transporter [Burkholderiales bacterium]
MSGATGARSVFSYPSYRWLWFSGLATFAGQWVQMASMGWVVYELTGSGALVGAVSGVRALPMLLLAPLSGVAADRFDRANLLKLSQWMSAATSILFGAALAMDLINIWMMFLFAIVMGACAVLDRPARQSTAFELVPRDMVMKAVALNTIGGNLARVVAPALAGYLIVWIGVAGNFYVQGALYILSGLLVLKVVMPVRETKPNRGSAGRQLIEGLRHVWREPTTRLLFILGALPFFLVVPTMGTLFPIYAKDVFAEGPSGLGLMFSAVGIGGVTGGFLAGWLARFDRTGWIQVGAVMAFCASIVGLGLSPTFSWALLACALSGMTEMIYSVTNMTMVQLAAPEEMRGRVSSILQLYPALISLGAFLIGPLADLIGARGTSIATACFCGAVFLLIMLISPRMRGMRLSQYTGKSGPALVRH